MFARQKGNTKITDAIAPLNVFMTKQQQG